MADQTLVYFISDGEPNSGHAVDSTVVYTTAEGSVHWRSRMGSLGQ